VEDKHLESVLNWAILPHAMAYADPSEPVVKKAEERALAGAVATDVKDRANTLIKQLEDTDRHGVRTFSILPLVSSFFCAFI
jgi:hypothetical protein